MNFGVVAECPWNSHRAIVRGLTGVKSDGQHPDMCREPGLVYHIPPENKEPKWVHTFGCLEKQMWRIRLCSFLT